MPETDKYALPERPSDPRILFVGGTGRAGTHILSQLLEHHSVYARVPIEARFHVNPLGFPDLLSGAATPEQFVRKLRKFWWRRIRAGEVAPVLARRLAFGRKERGLYKVVPEERFEAAVAAFERDHPAGLESACRNLFLDLLWPLATEAGKPGLIEMSCFTVAASPALHRLFPGAKIVHTVRDGRDAGASKVSKRQKRSHPRDGFEGIRWWEGRLRKIEAGVRELPAGVLHTLSLDELVDGDRDRVYGELLDYLGVADEPAMREFFETEMSASAAHKERWREGLDPDAQANLVSEYERTLERLEREGFHCAPHLRRAYDRQPA